MNVSTEHRTVSIRDLIGTAEASKISGVTPNYLRNLGNVGKIPSYRKSGRVYFKKSDIEKHFLLIDVTEKKLELDI